MLHLYSVHFLKNVLNKLTVNRSNFIYLMTILQKALFPVAHVHNYVSVDYIFALLPLYLGSEWGSILWPSTDQTKSIGWSPLAGHSSLAVCPTLDTSKAVCLANCAGARNIHSIGMNTVNVLMIHLRTLIQKLVQILIRASYTENHYKL